MASSRALRYAEASACGSRGLRLGLSSRWSAMRWRWYTDARLPTRAALARLVAPFEQVKQEDVQSADQLALFRPAHAVDFLGDVLDVGLCELAGAQEFGLLAAPGVEIAIVERALRGHERNLGRLLCGVYRSEVELAREVIASRRQMQAQRAWSASGLPPLNGRPMGTRGLFLVRSLAIGLVEPFVAVNWRSTESHFSTLETVMLDKPEKTRQLMATLKAALPFEVELTPHVLAHLRSQGVERAVETRQTVSQVDYAGDEGGIVCRLLPRETDNAMVLSLSHVRVERKNPFAGAVFDYQKHRVKG